MAKPTRKVVMRGQPGNKWKSYEINYEGKLYVHQNKVNADRQWNAIKRLTSLTRKAKPTNKLRSK